MLYVQLIFALARLVDGHVHVGEVRQVIVSTNEMRLVLRRVVVALDLVADDDSWSWHFRHTDVTSGLPVFLIPHRQSRIEHAH